MADRESMTVKEILARCAERNLPSPLPDWAEPHPTNENAVLVDPDKAYPAILQEFVEDDRKAKKFDIEVAYQFMKMDLQRALKKFGFTILIRADDGRKNRWNLSMFPGSAEDVALATNGRMAREIYKRVRGTIP